MDKNWGKKMKLTSNLPLRPSSSNNWLGVIWEVSSLSPSGVVTQNINRVLKTRGKNTSKYYLVHFQGYIFKCKETNCKCYWKIGYFSDFVNI